jgi:hypothetical protein
VEAGPELGHLCGFGQACLWSLLSRVVGANPARQDVSPQAEGMPDYEWLMTMVTGQFGESSLHGLLNRMIEGLALAWEFGPKLATVLERDLCRRQGGSESWGLEPDLRLIAGALCFERA